MGRSDLPIARGGADLLFIFLGYIILYMNTLTAEKRDVLGKHVKTLRAAGQMPAVVYGAKEPSTPITILLKEFEKVFKKVGESSAISLSGLGGEPLSVLIHEVDYDPVTSVPRHADFYAIEKGTKVEVSVSLTFAGESPAIKAGANLVKVLHEVDIEAQSDDLPHEIPVDLSVLVNIDDQIHARDLKMPHGVTLKTPPDEIVVLAQEVEEDAEESSETPDMASIEVEKKNKQSDTAGGDS